MKQPRTLADMQDVLWDQIDKLAQDETTPAKANAVANLTGKVLAGVRLQMDYSRLSGRPLPEIPLLSN